jgi:hypothetical protein
MRARTLSLAVLLVIGAPACVAEGGGEDGDGQIGAAAAAQLDPGYKDYVIYGLTDVSGFPLGQVLVTSTAGGGYAANREYWYMTSNLSNSSAVRFSGRASEYWSTLPSGLGTLSFTTVRTPTWTSANTRGTMLVYENPLTGEYDAMNWGMSNSSGTWTGSIVWWHESTGNLFGDSVTRTLSPTSTSGTHYYYVSTPL